MSGFSSFNGTYRRIPTVSIRGNSKSETREQLLERAQKERLRRETDRVRKSAALKIQRYYRGHMIRQKYKSTLRAEFDVIQNAFKKFSVTSSEQNLQPIEIKTILATQLLTFFDVNQDGDRLAWFCQLLVRERGEFLGIVNRTTETHTVDEFGIGTANWPYKIGRLINLSLLFMATAPSQVRCLFKYYYLMLYLYSNIYIYKLMRWRPRRSNLNYNF